MKKFIMFILIALCVVSMLGANEVMSESDMYWVTRLDGLKDVLIIFAVLLGILSVILFIGHLMSMGNMSDTIIVCVIFIFLTIASILTPTTNEMVLIKVVPKIANNESIQDIGKNGMEILNKYLDAWKNNISNPTK